VNVGGQGKRTGGTSIGGKRLKKKAGPAKKTTRRLQAAGREWWDKKKDLNYLVAVFDEKKKPKWISDFS